MRLSATAGRAVGENHGGFNAGGGVFTSFDRDAVALIAATGGEARLLTG
jgi:hypothetical protein